MKTRIVHTRMWEDEFFVNLSKDGKILFIYLLTNQRINLVGCYKLSDRTIMFDTGLSKEELSKAKEEVSAKAKFTESWVYLPNAARLGGYSGKKNEIAFLKEMGEIPQYVIECLNVDTVSLKLDTLSDILDTPINHKSEIINNKSEIINQKLKTINHKSEESIGVPQSTRDMLRARGLKV